MIHLRSSHLLNYEYNRKCRMRCASSRLQLLDAHYNYLWTYVHDATNIINTSRFTIVLISELASSFESSLRCIPTFL
jgi:hypothetical protein